MQVVRNIDIFTAPAKYAGEAMCITTNGMIKTNGLAVMGKGIAKTADDKWKVAKELAEHLRQHGNVPCDLGIHNGYRVLTFPTKNDWRNDSDLDLIKNSATIISQMADNLHLNKIYIPPVGCGCGNLSWDLQVEPLLRNILDNRFIAVLR